MVNCKSLVDEGREANPEVFAGFDQAFNDALVLAAAVHSAVDWETWGGHRLKHYWDAMRARVELGRTAGPDLADWWDSVTKQMAPDAPRSGDRRIVAGLINGPTADDVLAVFENRSGMVIQVLRLCVDAKRANRDAEQERETNAEREEVSL